MFSVIADSDDPATRDRVVFIAADALRQDRLELQTQPILVSIWGSRFAGVELWLWIGLWTIAVTATGSAVAQGMAQAKALSGEAAVRHALGASSLRIASWWARRQSGVLAMTVAVSLTAALLILGPGMRLYLNHQAMPIGAGVPTLLACAALALAGCAVAWISGLMVFRRSRISERLLMSGAPRTSVMAPALILVACVAALVASSSLAVAVSSQLAGLYVADVGFDWRGLGATEVRPDGTRPAAIVGADSDDGRVAAISALPLHSAPPPASVRINGQVILNGDSTGQAPPPVRIYTAGRALTVLRARLLEGVADPIRYQPNRASCTVNRTAALAYFGSTRALGEVINFIGTMRRGVVPVLDQCVVGGVVEDLPFQPVGSNPPLIFVPYPTDRHPGTAFVIFNAGAAQRAAEAADGLGRPTRSFSGRELFLDYYRTWHVWAVSIAIMWLWAVLATAASTIAVCQLVMETRKGHVAIAVCLGASGARALFTVARLPAVAALLGLLMGSGAALMLFGRIEPMAATLGSAGRVGWLAVASLPIVLAGSALWWAVGRRMERRASLALRLLP